MSEKETGGQRPSAGSTVRTVVDADSVKSGNNLPTFQAPPPPPKPEKK